MLFIDDVSLMLWLVTGSLTTVFLYGRQMFKEPPEKLKTFAPGLVCFALPLAILGFLCIITWPLPGAANIVVGFPSCFFGMLLIIAAWLIARGEDVRTMLRLPALFGGSMLIILALAIIMNRVGAPPASEGAIGQPPVAIIISLLWAIAYSSTGAVAIIAPRVQVLTPSWYRILSVLILISLFLFGSQAVISLLSHVAMFSAWHPS